MRSSRVTGRGKKGKGGGGADQMEHRGKEEKEGEGSAEPQLNPLMLHVSVLRSTPCRVTKKRMNTKISVFAHVKAEFKDNFSLSFYAFSGYRFRSCLLLYM